MGWRLGADLGSLSRWPRSGEREARAFQPRSRIARVSRPRGKAASDGAAELEYAAVVAVPGEHSRGAAIRPPCFCELAQLLLARLVRQTHQASQLNHHCEIAGREHVGPPFREQQINFRRPAADALDLCQERNRFLILFWKVFQIELTGEDKLGKASEVT